MGALLLSLLCVSCSLPKGGGNLYNSGWKNAAWLEHAWVDTPLTTERIEELKTRVAEAKITTVFLHVGPLEKDGTISEKRIPYIEENREQLEEELPELEKEAWIGQREQRGGGPLDLTKKEVRNAVIKTAKSMVEDYGFDGIHYNIEPVPLDDPEFYTFLEETKKAIGKKSLTISLTPVEPFSGIHSLTALVRGDGIFVQDEQYAKVLERVDGVAVMAYDTGLQKKEHYTLFMEYEVKKLERLALQKGKALWIGIPSYKDKRANFSHEVENISTALEGVRRGKSKYSQLRGIALYAYWTTDAQEWQALKEAFTEEKATD
jgi:hypothetical protein